MKPPEPDPAEPQARSYTIEDVVCYHEAAHAVAWWHYGIGLRCVTVRPDDSGHRGHSSAVEHTPVGVVELENEMRCTAAGEIADKFFRGRRLPTEFELAFDIYARRLSREPDLAVEDKGAFVGFGLARDAEIRTAGSGAPIGPAAWFLIWQEAVDLIRDELWPAVKAVAEELRTGTGCLDQEGVAALPSAACPHRGRQ
jgi:hypothetical protein